jgi:hypothetical protein
VTQPGDDWTVVDIGVCRGGPHDGKPLPFTAAALRQWTSLWGSGIRYIYNRTSDRDDLRRLVYQFGGSIRRLPET